MDENSAQQNQTVLRRPVRPIPQEVAPRKMRIKIWMGWALIISAICVDLVELLGGYISFEIIATIVGWVASFVFWVWFLWTLGMVTIVGMVRMEDKGEKPSIIGGFLEGFALAETLNPVALPIAIGTTGLNRARRFVKRKAGVGQANWVKQDEETDNADTAMGSIDRIQQI